MCVEINFPCVCLDSDLAANLRSTLIRVNFKEKLSSFHLGKLWRRKIRRRENKRFLKMHGLLLVAHVNYLSNEYFMCADYKFCVGAKSGYKYFSIYKSIIFY